MSKNKVLLFIDDDPQPFGEFETPINFEFDTTKLVDGEHTLTIVGKSPSGREGIRRIPFTVRNGPAIVIEGLTQDTVVDGVIPIMINSYGKGDPKKFLIEGSETPTSIPSWLWAAILIFFGWAAYYIVISFS